MANIGFIGLGNMGGPMASNLLKAGHSVRAFDLVDSALQAIANEGGEACDKRINRGRWCRRRDFNVTGFSTRREPVSR